jgi:hypothetical protein
MSSLGVLRSRFSRFHWSLLHDNNNTGEGHTHAHEASSVIYLARKAQARVPLRANKERLMAHAHTRGETVQYSKTPQSLSELEP